MDDEQFQRISKTLADPARFEALQRIASQGELTCTCLCEHLQLTAATVSHHVKELAAADVVQQRREGKFLRLTLNRPVWRAYLRELARRVPLE